MSKFEADVWLGSHTGRQKIYVNSNTWYGAREQIKSIYKVDDEDIWDLTESNESNYSYESSSDSDPLALILLLVVGYVGMAVLYAAVYIGPIALVIWLIMRWWKSRQEK